MRTRSSCSRHRSVSPRSLRLSALALALLAALSVAAPASALVTIDWVAIGNPGNAADTPSNCFAENCGSVPYEYQISKYAITNAQYAEFLNAKAASDPLALYNTSMGSDATFGGITRSGVSGSYSYAVNPGFANKPVVFVNFYDSLRFANWLNNGQGSGDTETGAYTLFGGTATPSNGLTVTRNGGASIFLTSENEWYKAAYYDPLSTSYFDYPTGTNIYGTYDLGDNVYEWNEQIVLDWYREFRNILGASSDLPFSDPTWEYVSAGFRVASAIPEPGTGLLVMAGLAGLAARRRRPAQAL